MISFFTVAKPFSGHTRVIQRNALQSWKRLHPDCEVMLLGDDSGSAEVARELGLTHVPEIGRNEFGTPLVSALFAVAGARAKHDLLCYVNADIILLPDFIHAARRVQDLNVPFLMCGRRWKLDVTEEITFEEGWAESLQRDAVTRGHLDYPVNADYFLFTKGLFGEIPPFAIGRRGGWDRWLQYRGRSRSGLYIDATEVVTAVHQNHEYGPGGYVGRKRGPETERNVTLSGDQICTLREAPYKLTKTGVKRAFDWVRLEWRVRKTADMVGSRLKALEARLSAKLVGRPRRLLKASHAFRRLLKTGSARKPQRVAVIGLGKVGFPLAVCLAYKGCKVVGVDADPEKVAAIQSGRPPLPERAVDQLLARSRNRLAVQRDAERAVCLADATLLVLPTQRPNRGGFTPEYLLQACETVGRVLATMKGYHLIIIVSTVLPGWTGGMIRTTLERASGKNAGRDFGLCYCPALIALGNAVEGFLSPDLALIGESDPEAGMRLVRILAQMWIRPPHTVRTNFINAELAKLALNTYVSTKISFANVLAQMCEQLPGANVDLVTTALQRDRRVGRGYLTGAVGYGGPCFPGDVPAFAALARQLGAPDDLAVATDVVNTRVNRHLLDLVRSTTPPRKTVGICGVSCKPETGAVDGSPGIWTARELEAAGYAVVLYDPHFTEHTARDRGCFDVASSFDDCIRRSDTVVLAMPYEEFAGLTTERLQHGGARRTVIDCWRILDPGKISGAAQYHALGLGPPSPDAPMRQADR